MLRLLLIFAVMSAGLATTNAQVALQLTNNSGDTWTLSFTDNSLPPVTDTQTLPPLTPYSNFYPVITYPVVWNANNGLGCSRSGIIFAPPASNLYPVPCSSNTLSVDVNNTPFLGGNFISIEAN